MALQPGQLDLIAAAVDDPAAPDLTARLRAQFPGLSFTACSDDDIIGGRPALQREGFNLYLVGGGSHCMSLTRDAEVACGVVVAEVMPE